MASPIIFYLGAAFHHDGDGVFCMAPQKVFGHFIQIYEQMFGACLSQKYYLTFEKGDQSKLDMSELIDHHSFKHY